MPVDFTQTASATGSCSGAGCSGLNTGGGTPQRICEKDGTGAPSVTSLTINAGATNVRIVHLTCRADLLDLSWDAGTWTVRLNVTTSNMNVSWESVHICRVNSLCANQETLGSASGLGINLGSAGVQEVEVSGSAASPASGDRVFIIAGFTNSNAMTAQSFGITFDQIVASPFEEVLEPTGTIAQTLPTLTQAASGTLEVTGTASQTLPVLLQDAAGTVEEAVDGDIAQTLPALIQEVTGEAELGGALYGGTYGATYGGGGTPPADVEGTISQVLPTLTQAASGTLEATSSAAQTLPALTQQAAGSFEVQGSSTQNLPVLTQAGSGQVGTDISGSIAQSLPTLTQAAAGEATVEGTATQGLPTLQQQASGLIGDEASGTIAQALPVLTQSAAGELDISSSGASALPGLMQSMAGHVGDVIPAPDVKGPTRAALQEALNFAVSLNEGRTYADPQSTAKTTATLTNLPRSRAERVGTSSTTAAGQNDGTTTAFTDHDERTRAELING